MFTSLELINPDYIAGQKQLRANCKMHSPLRSTYLPRCCSHKHQLLPEQDSLANTQVSDPLASCGAQGQLPLLPYSLPSAQPCSRPQACCRKWASCAGPGHAAGGAGKQPGLRAEAGPAAAGEAAACSEGRRLPTDLSSSRRRRISSSSSRWMQVPSLLIFSKCFFTSSLHSAWGGNVRPLPGTEILAYTKQEFLGKTLQKTAGLGVKALLLAGSFGVRAVQHL